MGPPRACRDFSDMKAYPGFVQTAGCEHRIFSCENRFARDIYPTGPDHPAGIFFAARFDVSEPRRVFATSGGVSTDAKIVQLI